MNDIYRSDIGARLLREDYVQALKGWPVEHERRRVPTPEGETFVVACGPTTAPPLVLLHGSGANSSQWLDRIVELAAHFRVYAVDVIGEPGLSAPSRPSPGSDRYAVWLETVLDYFAVERVSIMGVSLGGWLALDFATRRPGRVRRLALSCPPGLGKPKKAYQVKALPLSLLGRWGRRRFVTSVLGPGLASMEPAQVESLIERVLLVSKHYRYRSSDLPVFDDATLRGLTMPVHVVVGQADVMWDGAETKRRLDALAPDATVRLLPAVGHVIAPQLDTELEFLTGSPQHG